MEFSSPEIWGKTKGVCYIVATAMFLIETASEDIMLADTASDLTHSLTNFNASTLNSEYVISRISEIQARTFVKGGLLSRILNIKGKHDEERIERELDHDLIFEQVMWENQAIYQTMLRMGPQETDW